MLDELLLKHADNLRITVQHKSWSAAECHQVASMTVKMLKGIGSNEQLHLFQANVTSKAGAVDEGGPALTGRKEGMKEIFIWQSTSIYNIMVFIIQ